MKKQSPSHSQVRVGFMLIYRLSWKHWPFSTTPLTNHCFSCCHLPCLIITQNLQSQILHLSIFLVNASEIAHSVLDFWNLPPQFQCLPVPNVLEGLERGCAWLFPWTHCVKKARNVSWRDRTVTGFLKIIQHLYVFNSKIIMPNVYWEFYIFLLLCWIHYNNYIFYHCISQWIMNCSTSIIQDETNEFPLFLSRLLDSLRSCRILYAEGISN